MTSRGRRVTGAANFDWLAVPESYRALVIRNRADEWFLAVQEQQARIEAYCREVHGAGGLHQVARARGAIGRVDLEFFIVALRRLHRVGVLIRRSRLPRDEALVRELRALDRAMPPVVSLRNEHEHLDDATLSGRGGTGYGIGPAGVRITHDGAELDTAALAQVAAQVHAAVRRVVDPLAAQDVHASAPIVDLPAHGDGHAIV